MIILVLLGAGLGIANKEKEKAFPEHRALPRCEQGSGGSVVWVSELGKGDDCCRSPQLALLTAEVFAFFDEHLLNQFWTVQWLHFVRWSSQLRLL